MEKPQVRMWIDARHEKAPTGRCEDIIYNIPQITTAAVWEAVYYTLAGAVREIQMPAPGKNLVKIIYEPERISPSFIDYLLLQKGIDFRRLNP